jgi:hypothetical protein
MTVITVTIMISSTMLAIPSTRRRRWGRAHRTSLGPRFRSADLQLYDDARMIRRPELADRVSITRPSPVTSTRLATICTACRPGQYQVDATVVPVVSPLTSSLIRAVACAKDPLLQPKVANPCPSVISR